MKRDKLRSPASVRPGYWFAPKTFGWGATPATWQGWAATLGFVVIAAMIGYLAEHRSPVWLALLVPVVVAFIALCWAKTDGGWAFRWGRGDR
ncbi:MAG: hypothetical protein EOP62_03480 [Sphingomonadales bacterium]|nr:MAG: hypothetical protein EOP62_03480 [Sphingomonadales bacterium]